MLKAVPAGQAWSSLRTALAGGSPIAPLPANAAEAHQALRMLQPARELTEPDAAVVVSTSGSTGIPKGVVLSRRAIRASAEATHVRLGGPGDWLLALPSHYVAGLMVLARAVVAETAVTDVGSDLSGLADAPRTGRPRYLSVVPTQLIRALDRPDLTAALAGLDAVLLGGAAAPAALLDRARDAGVPVITTYGMSETCGGCVYDGTPLDGVSVELETDGTSGSGRISIGGPVVFSGYRLRPELTAETLDPHGRFRTNDLGRWAQTQRLEVLGRMDDVVITGGLNVHLGEVERVLASSNALAGAECAVIAVPDQEWGSRLVAVTELREVDRTALARQLRSELPRHAVPTVMLPVSAFPRTSSGKIDRQRLRSALTMDLTLDPTLAERNRLR